MPVAVELNGLLPGRGPGRGALPGAGTRRGPGAARPRAAGRGAAVSGAAVLGAPGGRIVRGRRGQRGRRRGLALAAERQGRRDRRGRSGRRRGRRGLLPARPGPPAAGAAPARPRAPAPASRGLRRGPGRWRRSAAAAAGLAALRRRGLGARLLWPANASFSLRTTGASIVEDAERTNSPISWSLAITALLSTPNSFASSYTRTFATALPLLGPV